MVIIHILNIWDIFEWNHEEEIIMGYLKSMGMIILYGLYNGKCNPE